jgi:DNA recombination protein RmuC
MALIFCFLTGLLLGCPTAFILLRLYFFKDSVSRDQYQMVLSNCEEANENLLNEKAVNGAYRDQILELTRESEKKLGRPEIDQLYVARESFLLLSQKLNSSEEILATKEEQLISLTRRIAEMNQKEEYLDEKLNTFQKEIEQLHQRSREQFRNLASEIMEEKRKSFIETNKIALDSIIEPLQERMKEFRERIEATRKEEIQEMTSLKHEICSIEKLGIQLSDDARNLALALKSDVKIQGSWGEERLNMILEAEGLQKYIDFGREEVFWDPELEMDRRPDFILRLPDDKHIVIDSKVSLKAYVNYFNADNPEEKKEYLKLHLRSVSNHIDELSNKNYQSLHGIRTPDYVFLFMPVESALTLAFNQNPDIFNQALKKKIVLITPTILVATLKIVKMLWQKENQVKNVEEIFRQCGELYDKFVLFLEQIKGVEDGLQSALKAHKEAMYSLTEGTRKGNTVIGRFEAIRRLEARTNRRIPEEYIREMEWLNADTETQTNPMPPDAQINSRADP